MLDAAGRIGANQLARVADHDLESANEGWQKHSGCAANNRTAESRRRRRLQMAREVQARAAEGRYSVAPLFNDADNQVGELVAFDGTAAASRGSTWTIRPTAPSDVARRFGIDHYYEIDVFTDDSQNNPIVFCARELPPGLTIGDRLHEPVRIAGFFFKSWSFRSRRATLQMPRSTPAGIAAICPARDRPQPDLSTAADRRPIV